MSQYLGLQDLTNTTMIGLIPKELDSRDLVIEKVIIKETLALCNFEVSNPLNFTFGTKLTITLGPIESKSFTVIIEYVTSTEASALQWLGKEQTAGKRHPYLFSQCQAIHARSMFPCQDTPSVKFPFTAKIRAPKELTVLMSAKRIGTEPVEKETQLQQQSLNKVFPFQVIWWPLDIGPRTKVWSERELVNQAAFEFSQTEDMLKTAESLMGDYVWGPYDILVLPPSFPYGGMENPCLTFVTPTLLAGDKSLADVIAHEISHSWTGNLVTNSSFEHFWLNEGHTMFLERKILGQLHGQLHLQLHAHEGWNALEEAVKTLTKAGNIAYSKLVPDLNGVDPDDAFSIVPYEKGFALLYSLETLLGGPVIDNEVLLREGEYSERAELSFSSLIGLPPYEPKWLSLCIKVQRGNSVSFALEFDKEQGRMTLVQPMYRDLYDWEYSRPNAITNYLSHKEEMHNTTAMFVA
ncbi:Leukotriene A-4 hydrolase [Bulinus truncatus]|nr:Leukotriene A-4 hydrolase [Bulinus truncatus]